jgi:hypothetical protein
MEFRFDPSKHPQHGTEPVAIREIVPGWAGLMGTAGRYEYAGGTEMLWDLQEPDMNENHRVLLKDHQERTWEAERIQTEGEKA